MDAREYLRECMPTRKHVDDFVNPTPDLAPEDNNRGWTSDGEVGWVLEDAVRFDGLDGSKTLYHYESTGARRRAHYADQPCRIHTYGNSFTHCDQVNDGETWQEVLAAHLGEPVENYGVGGYGVYQAYLRMCRVERERPAEYVILNVYCDDHFRNLDSWRTIRFGRRTPCGFPLPHLGVDVDTGACEERPNPTPNADDVYRLMDEEFVYETFADDAALRCVLAGRERREVASDDVPMSFGFPHAAMLGADGIADFQRAYARSALLATQHVIELAEAFLAAQGSKLMVVLSHGGGVMAHALQGRPRWDQNVVDYLADKNYPVLDGRDAHLEDFRAFNISVQEYMKRFYVGHYAPAGNFFFAMALKPLVVDWLDPKPTTYADM